EEVLDAYVSASALHKAETLFETAAQSGLEAMGLLVGNVFTWKGRQYVVVENFITAKNLPTAVSVKFTKEAFVELSKAYSAHFKDRKLIVGWIHSHPSYGCFLSQTDINTQVKYFSAPFNIAMVVDPLRKHEGRMQERVFRVKANDYYEVSFAVIDKK
ncbi:MAG: Mov34/MPN/PAD-1 family protein, partial [Candidatus Micrarchaeota archaeon]